MKSIAMIMMAWVLALNASAAAISDTKREDLRSVVYYKFDTSNVSCDALTKRGLKQFQIENMYVSYQFGKERNMGYTLAAIAFAESSAGHPKFMRNPKDPSAGYHGVKLTNVMRMLNIPDTHTNRVLAEDMLVKSHGASAWFAMEILEWWMVRHKGNWFAVWRSYNGGYYWALPEGETKDLAKARTLAYANKIKSLIADLKTCNWS